MYQPDKLREYIENSVLRVGNDSFRIRLSDELAQKYDSGAYDVTINNLAKGIKQIEKLGIRYPSNAHPIFYVYIVPDQNFVELLHFPFKTAKGGGKPVASYDLDSFYYALGMSQNMFNGNSNILRIANDIHELAHLVHSQFFSTNRLLNEGFAEALPFYVMDYEKIFTDHLNAVKNITEDQLLSAEDLLIAERENTFSKIIIPNKSCSFRPSYISSYLFVRCCMEKIASKFDCDRVESAQKFLEIVKDSGGYRSEWLIFNIADAIGIPRDDLLNKKELQRDTLKKL